MGAISDTDRIGVVGYSMGGCGALISAGGVPSETAASRSAATAYVPPADLLDQHAHELHRAACRDGLYGPARGGRQRDGPYLDLVETAEDGVWSMTDDPLNADRAYWTGFGNNNARCLRLERCAAGE